MQKTSSPRELEGPESRDATAPLTRGEQDEGAPPVLDVAALLAAAEVDADVFPGVPLS